MQILTRTGEGNSQLGDKNNIKIDLEEIAYI
jgi:hypothetical protein